MQTERGEKDYHVKLLSGNETSLNVKVEVHWK
jgi:hypothetical protein